MFISQSVNAYSASIALCRVCREVVHLADFNLPFLVGAQDGFDNLRCGRAERYLCDYQRLVVVGFLYLRADFYCSSAFAVVVAAHVYLAACGEIGIERKLLPAQIRQRRIAYLAEVVRQYLRVQTHGNALHALCQQQRELYRQVDRLFLAPVVRQHPFRRLRVEHRIQRELAQPCFDVSRGCCAVACQDVAPVSLAVYQQVFLTQLHECVSDARIAVRVVLHRLSHDVRHFVHLAVVHAFHRVQDAALHGFQTVLYRGDGTFQYHIRSIVQEPVLVHARQVILHSIIEGILAHSAINLPTCLQARRSRYPPLR